MFLFFACKTASLIFCLLLSGAGPCQYLVGHVSPKRENLTNQSPVGCQVTAPIRGILTFASKVYIFTSPIIITEIFHYITRWYRKIECIAVLCGIIFRLCCKWVNDIPLVEILENITLHLTLINVLHIYNASNCVEITPLEISCLKFFVKWCTCGSSAWICDHAVFSDVSTKTMISVMIKKN